jgi:hypothetical protein
VNYGAAFSNKITHCERRPYIPLNLTNARQILLVTATEGAQQIAFSEKNGD